MTSPVARVTRSMAAATTARRRCARVRDRRITGQEIPQSPDSPDRLQTCLIRCDNFGRWNWEKCTDYAEHDSVNSTAVGPCCSGLAMDGYGKQGRTAWR